MNAGMHFYHSLGHLLFIKDHNELLVIGLLLMQNILLKCSRMNQQNRTFPLKMEDSLEITQTNDVNILFEKMQLRTVKWFVQGHTLTCSQTSTITLPSRKYNSKLLCIQMYSSEDEMGLLKYINATTKMTHFR